MEKSEFHCVANEIIGRLRTAPKEPELEDWFHFLKAYPANEAIAKVQAFFRHWDGPKNPQNLGEWLRGQRGTYRDVLARSEQTIPPDDKVQGALEWPDCSEVTIRLSDRIFHGWIEKRADSCHVYFWKPFLGKWYNGVYCGPWSAEIVIGGPHRWLCPWMEPQHKIADQVMQDDFGSPVDAFEEAPF
jgi:hypothetical protein